MPEATDHPEARELTDDEKHLAKLGLQPGPAPVVVRLLQLRDLVLDHLDPGRLLHQLRCRLQQRWPDLDLVDLADPGAFILLIGFTMSELVSAYPTSGGIYWWAAKLGGPAAGFFTGWLNLIGLVAVTAGCLVRLRHLHRPDDQHVLGRATQAIHPHPRFPHLRGGAGAGAAVLNIFSSHLMAVMNNVSVWWHVAGAAAIVPHPDSGPRPAPVVQLRLHRAIQQLRLRRRQHDRMGFWF